MSKTRTLRKPEQVKVKLKAIDGFPTRRPSFPEVHVSTSQHCFQLTENNKQPVLFKDSSKKDISLKDVGESVPKRPFLGLYIIIFFYYYY
jgi:hypothetical protein